MKVKTLRRIMIHLILLSVTFVFLSGCANFGRKMKALVSGKPTVTQAKKKKPRVVRYSENQSAGYRVPRKYKRMTRERLEKESKLEPQAGSLWVQEGQGSYLFAQNIMRRPGDIINVNLTGGPRKQLESKVNIIKKLMNRLERKRKMRRLASAKKGKSNKEGKKEKAKEAEKAAASPKEKPGKDWQSLRCEFCSVTYCGKVD